MFYKNYDDYKDEWKKIVANNPTDVSTYFSFYSDDRLQMLGLMAKRGLFMLVDINWKIKFINESGVPAGIKPRKTNDNSLIIELIHGGRIIYKLIISSDGHIEEVIKDDGKSCITEKDGMTLIHDLR